MNGFSLEGLLPMPPWQGPPLPRFLGIRWPRLPWEASEGGAAAAAGILYQNSEELEVVRDDTGLIQRVIRHIRVTRDV